MKAAGYGALSAVLLLATLYLIVMQYLTDVPLTYIFDGRLH